MSGRKKTQYRVHYEEILIKEGVLIRTPCTCLVEGKQELKEFLQGVFESQNLAYRSTEYKRWDTWFPYQIVS